MARREIVSRNEDFEIPDLGRLQRRCLGDGAERLREHGPGSERS